MSQKKKTNGHPPATVVTEEWLNFQQPALYADIIRVVANERHSILSFAQSRPDSNQFNIHTQVALHPKTAVELVLILADQLKQHEERFGRIFPEGVSITIKREKDGK